MAELFVLTGEGAKGESLVPLKKTASALGRMSSLALPAVILGEGKSLISKPGQEELVSVASSLPGRRKISDSKTRADRAL